MTCTCNPPCVLQRIDRMTKAQLKESLLDALTERDMAEVYLRDLETHLKKQHRCRHDGAAIAEGDGIVAVPA